MNAPATKPAPARNPGMDADTFAQFHEQLERYVRERLIPAEKDVIENDRVPDDILDEMKDMGLFGLSVPEDHGGAGLNMTQYAKIVKTMSYAAPAFRSIFSINIGMFNSALKNGGTKAQQDEWWPRIAAGEIACFGLTEPGSGSDSAAMATTAKPDPDGNGWILNGSKRYITNAPHADVALIMARTEKDALPKNAHVSAFIVPMDTPGVSTGSPDKKMGQSGSHISDVMLDDVHVPGEALLGLPRHRGARLLLGLDQLVVHLRIRAGAVEDRPGGDQVRPKHPPRLNLFGQGQVKGQARHVAHPRHAPGEIRAQLRLIPDMDMHVRQAGDHG